MSCSRPASQHDSAIDNVIPAAHALIDHGASTLCSGCQAIHGWQLCDSLEPDFRLDGMAVQARDWRIVAADEGHEGSQLGQEEV